MKARVKASDAFKQIDAAITVADAALDAAEEELRSSGQFAEAVTICASTVDRLTAQGSSYEQQAQRILSHLNAPASYLVEEMLGVLKALRRDIADGYLASLEEEVHADLFSDFLEMADHLVQEQLVLPAAVVAGAALEAQLRTLAERVGINTEARGKPKRAGKLNDDLAKKGVYRKAEQKQVLAWQDLRNSAAHGDDGFSAEEIRLMIQGIRDFIARHPA
jgi:hypothetical protein